MISALCSCTYLFVFLLYQHLLPCISQCCSGSVGAKFWIVPIPFEHRHTSMQHPLMATSTDVSFWHSIECWHHWRVQLQAIRLKKKLKKTLKSKMSFYILLNYPFTIPTASSMRKCLASERMHKKKIQVARTRSRTNSLWRHGFLKAPAVVHKAFFAKNIIKLGCRVARDLTQWVSSNLIGLK